MGYKEISLFIALINIIGCKQIGLDVANGLLMNNDAYFMKSNILKEHKHRNRIMKDIGIASKETLHKIKIFTWL